VVREGCLSCPGDRGRRSRRRRSRTPVGKDRAQLAAGVAAPAARARLLAVGDRTTRPPNRPRRQAPERGRLVAGRSPPASCSPRPTAAGGRRPPGRGGTRVLSSSGDGGVTDVFYSIPNPHPPGELVERAPSAVTGGSQLRHECVAIRARLSPAARWRDGFRPPFPVAWLHMHEGTWTLADCPPAAQSELAR